MKLRAHNLLCIQGFVGKGYSPAFVSNMSRVVGSLKDETEVEVSDAPDELCGACPHLSGEGCSLHGPGSERGIVHQDRDVLERLSLKAGETVPWGEIRRRVRRGIEPDDLDDICGSCPWLPLGHCKEGLRRLRGRERGDHSSATR